MYYFKHPLPVGEASIVASGSRRLIRDNCFAFHDFSVESDQQARAAVGVDQTLAPLEAENVQLREQVIELALQIQKLRGR